MDKTNVAAIITHGIENQLSASEIKAKLLASETVTLQGDILVTEYNLAIEVGKISTPCQWKKQHTYAGIGKLGVSYCGKPAVCQDHPNGRHLCQSHYNRWKDKTDRAAVRQTLAAQNISYSAYLDQIRRMGQTHEHWHIFRHKMY